MSAKIHKLINNVYFISIAIRRISEQLDLCALARTAVLRDELRKVTNELTQALDALDAAYAELAQLPLPLPLAGPR